MARVLVLYYSSYGHVETMANAVADGARAAGATVDVKRVPETVPLDIANIHGIAALTSMITLTPGTVSAALSDDRRFLLVHVLHLDDPDALIAEIKARYEKPLMEIFP